MNYKTKHICEGLIGELIPGHHRKEFKIKDIRNLTFGVKPLRN